jgi:hypothetical protein
MNDAATARNARKTTTMQTIRNSRRHPRRFGFARAPSAAAPEPGACEAFSGEAVIPVPFPSPYSGLSDYTERPAEIFGQITAGVHQ